MWCHGKGLLREEVDNQDQVRSDPGHEPSHQDQIRPRPGPDLAQFHLPSGGHPIAGALLGDF